MSRSGRSAFAFPRVLALLFLGALAASCQTPGPAGTQEQFIVFFPSEDAVLDTNAQSVIARVAERARAERPDSIIVYGFADRLGDRTRNERLSRERAAAVAQALVQAGVPQELVFDRGLGETATVAPPSDLNPEGRRVEIVLLR